MLFPALAAALLLAACSAEVVVPMGASGYRVLTERDFNRIVPGQWTRADVERELGPPDRVEGVASWNGPIWTYRWRDAQGARMFYSVYLDPQGVVRRAHPSMEVRDRMFGWPF